MNLQLQKPRLPVFAYWAIIGKPFSGEKHTLSNGKISYTVKPGKPYANHIETAGFYAASIISYGADKNGYLRLMRHCAYPSLRLYPNLTHSQFDRNFKGLSFKVNGNTVKEKAVRFDFDGILHIYTEIPGAKLHHMLFAAPESKALTEIVEIENTVEGRITVDIVINDKPKYSSPCFGADRKSYHTYVQSDKTSLTLSAGESETAAFAYCACEKGGKFSVDCLSEFEKRKRFLELTADFFVVESPDSTINAMARYAKIRACESIFKTKSGLMHSPGGGGYYAALWTNDQCEYVNPLFAYLGYDTGFEQALNSYALYSKYISADKALITSIISEGDGIWHGAKDRGDSAMYAYGCSRFLLSAGDKKLAEKYIDLIRDCVAYTKSQTGANGVIRSDSDELENRFESGSYNLCTSCLAYDAYISCSYIERGLGNTEKADELVRDAEQLRFAIEKYFGASVEGFKTYRYCDEEKNLRSWISAPLTVGIFDRADETVKALMSEKLLKNEGLVTRSGEKTFWDRSTLYALRGMFMCGKADTAYSLLSKYSRARLLGEHIPYAVEAFPEGNQAQLSAESGLYLRIYSEGILGYRPTGFDTFEICPHLPEKWNEFSIRRLKLCGKDADICVKRTADSYEITVTCLNNTETVKGDKAVFKFD